MFLYLSITSVVAHRHTARSLSLLQLYHSNSGPIIKLNIVVAWKSIPHCGTESLSFTTQAKHIDAVVNIFRKLPALASNSQYHLPASLVVMFEKSLLERKNRIMINDICGKLQTFEGVLSNNNHCLQKQNVVHLLCLKTKVLFEKLDSITINWLAIIVFY